MISKETEKIIKENERRLKKQAQPYDPIKGVGSPIERVRLYFNNSEYINIPQEMANHSFIAKIKEFKSVEVYCKKHGSDRQITEYAIIQLRIKYDFEFWCSTCVKIQDKLSKQIVNFSLRHPQLKLVKVLMDKINKSEPIRVIVLKARQWGGSTVVQMFMAWIQLFHRTAWHSVIVADIEDQSRNIKSMYSRLALNHPLEVQKMTLENFEGSTKNKRLKERDTIIYIGSMQKPDSIRSADVMMAHLSEVGLWHATDGKRPEDIVQSIAGTVPLEPYSMIVMESTAKGIGNFFHREWTKAINNESGYTPVFVSWYEIDMYQKQFTNHKEQLSFITSMTPLEKSYFKMGATLEGVNWYRNKKHTESYDTWRMGCEFPTTPQEAFQSTGRRAHSPEYTTQMRKHCSMPKYIGELHADAQFGTAAINSSLKFEETPNGTLNLWAMPERDTNISNRYIVSMDIGGRTTNADWSVISVIDRYWLIDGGVEECIGTYRFHLDQDLAVWKAVQTARFFCNALLVIEANSLNSKGTEGDHTLTILDEIKSIYTNLYIRTDPQKIKEGAPARFGFYTTSSSKTDLVTQMNKRFREMLYIERDSRAIDEAEYYEIKEDGTYGAVIGEHDDIYMSRAIGLKASQISDYPKQIRKEY